jgi:diguanylate cyclase (GGDEF)-like protein
MTHGTSPKLNTPLIEKYRDRFEDSESQPPVSHAEAAEIFNAYLKLERRLARIAKISDAFQSELRELKGDLEHLSRTDPLTGLANRRDIYEKLEAEQSRCRRNGKIFSLIMADFDFFKQINDNYGHAAGDQFLVAVTQIFQSNLRKEDCCARWGGEEFLILLPETETENALKTAEKLRQRVADYTLEVQGAAIRATLSAGISTYRHNEEIDICIARADEALYQAKKNGRNQAIVYDTSDEDHRA